MTFKDLKDRKTYELTINGKPVKWTGERIKNFMLANRIDKIELDRKKEIKEPKKIKKDGDNL